MPTAAAKESGANLASEIRNLPDAFLACRSQHRWNETKPMHIADSLDEGELVEQHDQCERCETVKISKFLLRMDRWGVQRLEVRGSDYAYPDGYLIPAARLADHPREIFRYEKLRRSMGGTVRKPRKRKAA